MKQFSLLLFGILLALSVRSQVCVTQQMDVRSPELIEAIERELAGAEFVGQRSVQCLQTVVHVIWHYPQHNVSDSIIHAMIELVNADLRRQNEDTSFTPDYFLPVAADMEIELNLAQVDPNGQPTNGITHTFTDSTRFEMDWDHMKYDSTGGKTAWDTEHYFNVWVIRSIVNNNFIGPTFSYGILPGFNDPDRVGLVAANLLFEPDNWRTLTHEVGHFLGLLDLYGVDSCSNNDLVNDTPVGLYHSSPLLECGDTVVSCSNGSYGDMFMNFMCSNYYWNGCQNLFTQGQKARMDNWLMTQVPGWLDCYSLGVDDVKTSVFEVFPNPTTDFLHFQSSDRGSYSFLDVRGREIGSGMAQSGKNSVDVSHLPTGIYLLKLQLDEGISTARFVKN